MRALFVLPVLLAATTASAQSADESFRRGVEELRAGAYEAAETAFRASLRAEPRAATYCNLALTYERWGEHRREAAAAYADCAEADESGRFRNHATERARALREELAREAPETPSPAEGDPPNPFADAPPPEGPTSDAQAGQGGAAVTGARHTTETDTRSFALLGTGLTASAVGVAFVVAAAVVAGKGRDDVRWLEENVGPPPVAVQDGTEAAERVESADRRRRRSLALYVSGGLLGAAGFVLVAVDVLKPHRRTAIEVRPMAGGGTVGVRGSF